MSCGRNTYEGVDIADLVPRAYVREVSRSLDLAGDNGPNILSALTDAPTEDREAMAFVVAGLPPVDLATTDAELLLENARLAREARESFPWGAQVSDEMFLHYVLPPRVSQEPLEAWRPYLFDRLSERLGGITSMNEAALEVNRWCGERVGFRPTQRRDQGVFETLASGYGRCEEMMIVHIAALRSVGIPARQAWTPYWSTSDNNHAWTELWVDGDWHYAGACEPADRLDRAWFDNTVKGAALVMSSVFGSDPPEEDVYRDGDRYSLVNSIAGYTDTGVISVKVTDGGRPVAGVPVTVSVFNFGALRAIARQETDSSGRTGLAIGRGEYFVAAGSQDGYDWEVVRAARGDTSQVALELDSRPPFSAEFKLVYGKDQ